MEDREIARRLKGFEAVWRRVGAEKSAATAAARQGVRLMPGKGPAQGGRRYESRRG